MPRKLEPRTSANFGNEQETDAAHEAIGRYVVIFSRLVSEMRMLLAWHISSERRELAEIALGESPAMQICHAFFGLCRKAAGYTDDEAKVAKLLGEEVETAIRRRNDVAHGDWQIGTLRLTRTRLDPMPPQLARIKPRDKAGPVISEVITVQEIERLADEVFDITKDVSVFGRLALGLPTERRGAQGKRELVVGEYRVGDLFVVQGRGRNAEVVRAGARADELP
jgi:hypothetical protein